MKTNAALEQFNERLVEIQPHITFARIQLACSQTEEDRKINEAILQSWLVRQELIVDMISICLGNRPNKRRFTLPWKK